VLTSQPNALSISKSHGGFKDENNVTWYLDRFGTQYENMNGTRE